MKNTVKLTSNAEIGINKSDRFFKLTFPIMSTGPGLFLQFLELKKDHFKENPSFITSLENKNPDEVVFVIRFNWVREIAQECEYYIKKNICPITIVNQTFLL